MMPTDYCLRLQARQRVEYFVSQDKARQRTRRSTLLRGHLLRRSRAQHIELVAKNKDLSLKAVRDRNNPAIAHQMNPQRSPIGPTINRFAGCRQPLWVSGRHALPKPAAPAFTIDIRKA